LGGLHVILSERHEAGRIDRQLIGRCARQGDPGKAEAILSLEDPLLLPYRGGPSEWLARGFSVFGDFLGGPALRVWIRYAQYRTSGPSHGCAKTCSGATSKWATSCRFRAGRNNLATWKYENPSHMRSCRRKSDLVLRPSRPFGRLDRTQGTPIQAGAFRASGGAFRPAATGHRPVRNAGKKLGDDMECLVEPHLVTSLGSPVEGTLSEVLVDRGAFVTKGEVVARLNSTVEAATVNLKSAQEEFGKRKVERNEELYKKQLISG